MAKRYYWLKLKEDFFEEDTIEWLEEQENGKEYCLFYLKMCLKSIKTEGILIRKVGNMLVPYDAKHLSKITNTDIDTVRVAIDLFKKIGLIQILETGEIYIPGLEDMVGSETDKAKFMRSKRAKDKALLQDSNNLEQSSNNVTQNSNNVTNDGNNVTQNSNNVTNDGNNVTNVLPNCYTEQEQDIEQEKELDLDIEQEIKQLGNSTNNKVVDNVNNVDNLEQFDADAVYILNYYLPNLSTQDKKRVLSALKDSGNDFYYLEEKIKVLQQRENINSVAGFLVKAIKDDYKLRGAC